MADQFPTQQNFYDAEKDLRTVSAVSNSRDPDTGVEIDTWQTRTGGQTDTLKGRLDKLGLLIVGDTTTGVTLQGANEVVLNNTSGSIGLGNYYSWGGNFPKVVSPGADPAPVGSGYTPRTDVILRSQLASAVGAALVRMTPVDAPAGVDPTSVFDILSQFRDVIQHGADPTGVELSDAAFASAFGDSNEPCCVWMGVPEGKNKAIYRISELVWMSIRKQLRGAGSDLVEIVVDNTTPGSCPRAVVGDAYSHASGFTIRNAQPSISRSAMVSNSQTTSNGWRDGSMYDIHIKDFDYCIDGWNGLTLGLMFSNIYEKITFENYKTALRVGAGSNNNTYIGLTWLNGQIPIHFNNVTTMKFIGGAIEAHTGFDAVIEASSSINFDSTYFEPSNGISSTASTGSLKNCHMTNQTVANFLSATSDSHWSIDDIFDENAAGAATPGAQAWYISDAGSTVRLFKGRVGAGGIKTQRNGEDGFVQEVRRDLTGWYIQKFANGELEMHYNSESAGDAVMTGATATFERALTPPVAFAGLPVVQVGVYANAANSFLLQESPVITARSRIDGTVGIAAKRTGTTFADGYYFHLSIRGRWR